MSAEFAETNASGFAHRVIDQVAQRVKQDATFNITVSMSKLLNHVAALQREVALLEAEDCGTFSTALRYRALDVEYAAHVIAETVRKKEIQKL